VSFAIDRDEINRAFFGGEGEWGLPGTMHGLFSPAEVRQLYRHDLEEARRLVREAGHPNGVNLELIIHTEEEKTNISTMELLQAQLKKAGINLELKFYDKIDQRAKRRIGDFDLDHIPAGFSSLHDDLDSLQFGRFFSGSQQNYSKINDPELDRLLQASRRELDSDKRREIMRSTVRRVVDQAWGVDLLHAPKWRFWHPHVKNFRPNFGSQADYAMVWVEK
jgi:ABC-type transport system substrate-binding protein